MMSAMVSQPEGIIPPQPGEAFRWVRLKDRWGLVCEALQPLAPHVFTDKSWLAGPDGWREVADAVGAEPDQLVRPRQVHGADSLIYRAGRAAPAAAPADIVAGDDPSLAWCVQTADCVPILVADRGSGAVAAAHAGWRGTALRVASAAVASMIGLGSRPSDLVAAIGPSIGPCCYEVGADVRDRFRDAGFGAADLDGWFASVPAILPGNRSTARVPGDVSAPTLFLDLWRANRDQLAAAGIPNDRIFVAGLCTASHDQTFCSYRREGARAGRLAAVIRSSTPEAGSPKSEARSLKSRQEV
jgi:YfiH family protein